MSLHGLRLILRAKVARDFHRREVPSVRDRLRTALKAVVVIKKWLVDPSSGPDRCSFVVGVSACSILRDADDGIAWISYVNGDSYMDADADSAARTILLYYR